MKNRSFYSVLSLLGIVFLFGCHSPEKWIFEEKILLDNITPIGLVAVNQHWWISDVANNRIVKTDLKGNIIEEYVDFERPMHITLHQSKVYVPEYTTDTIKVIADGKTEVLPLVEKPDSPGGIAVSGNTIAIADFYNHRIILQTGDNSITFGREGHNQGELYYPTDVAIYNDKIYVADAYNNRVQVFDRQGISLQIIGDGDGINVATGITIANNSLFVADFEGNRVLVYDLTGNLKQDLRDGFDKPTDISINNDQMLVANYGANNIIIYERK